MMKRIICCVLAMVMLFSMLPTLAYANNTEAETVQLRGSSELSIIAEDTYGKQGETVELTVKLSDNPGITSAVVTVSFDEDLTLVAAESGDVFSDLAFSMPKQLENGGSISSLARFTWFADTVADENIKDGIILKLTFRIATDAKTDKKCSVTVSGEELIDKNNGEHSASDTAEIWVLDYMPGDVNGDGRIGMVDVLQLCHYIIDGCQYDPDGYALQLDDRACDVNDDGKIGMVDVLLICRYFNDGCITDPEGYNITLKPSTPKCSHTMQEVPFSAATCTEPGNISYWYCTTCGKYFAAADGKTELTLEKTVLPATGHTVVTDPAVAPTPTSEGKTEGSHCSVCGAIIVAQTTIPATEVKTHSIDYDIANGDPYLEKLLRNGEINNPNPTYYEEGSALTLKNLSVAGYKFLGWYDLPQNGSIVKKIDTSETDDYELYAVWEKIKYTVQYKSSLFLERSSDTYTVDTGLVLPTPKLSNYVFTGWADESGKLYSSTTIPVGTTGNMILEGNWTSERNKTWTKRKLDEPLTYTEDNTLYFVYEIGEIQNVPLYTIHDFGYISEGGVSKSETTTYSVTIGEEVAEQIAKTVGRTTTESSNWSLSSGWSDTTKISEEWLKEKQLTTEEAEEYVKNESSNWNISSGTSGSEDTSVGSSNQKGWENEAKITSSKSTTDGYKETGALEASLSAEGFGVKAEASTRIEQEESHSTTKTGGFEVGGTKTGTQMKTNNTTTSSGWNNSSSYGGSKSSSESKKLSTAISEGITEQYGYGQDYTTNQTSGESQGLEQSVSGSDEWSNSVTYNTVTGEETTRTWTTQATKSGYHRWIVAGTAHVFAVVGYDMETQSFFVYTYSVMDDETHEFEDYSYTIATYNDHENGVISFEIPYEVAEMVAERTTWTQGLKVDQATGTIIGYTGTDNCVVIPEYMNVGNGEVVKITGIKPGAFAGNTGIAAVVLSDFITEIPDDCFNGCTALERVLGGSITEIGSKAFYGCTSMQECAVRSVITSVGDEAFYGVGCAYFNCANADIAKAAANCGAKKIYIDLKLLTSADEMSNVELTIPTGTDFLSITGDGSIYTNLTILSEATETILNKVNLSGTGGVPLRTSSDKVVLNQSSISSTGLAVVLLAEECELSLQSTVTISSDNQNAMLCKSITFSEYNDNVNGELIVNDRILYVGSVGNTELVTKGEFLKITTETFDNMLNSFTAYFDARGGECDEESRSVPNSTKIGTLPTPTKEHYTFDGWYLEDGTAVTEDSVFSAGTDITLYAHWTPVPYSVTWSTGTGYGISVVRTASPNANAQCGALESGENVYYGDELSITYSANTGFTLSSQGKTAITVSGNVTNSDIYASASANSYRVTWSVGTGCVITVKRTDSPYANAGTDVLTSGNTVYYGDVLSITYTAKTGYSIEENGKTSVTVTGNVDGNTIYASASPNSYAYSIVYQSSNGTSLGSSSATYKFGTTNTITPPAKSGYNTPPSQTIVWDATSKTITFVYTPTDIGATVVSGTCVSTPQITLYAEVQYRNRTATSVQVRVVWTSTIEAYGYTVYGQKVTATCGSSSSTATVAAFNAWSSSSSSARSSTGTTDWMTVSLNTTNQTTVSVGIYYYQVNSNGTDMTRYYGEGGYSGTWSMNIPAY